MNRSIKYIEKLNKLTFLDFLKVIGIKQSFINDFNKNVNWCTNKKNLSNFRLYLTYYDQIIDNTYIIDNSSDIELEIKMFRKFGFIARYAKYYVSSIEKILDNDTTVNWIFRIIESLISEDALDNFCKFVYKCHKCFDNESNKPTESEVDDNKSIDNNFFDGGDIITIYTE